MQWEFNKQFNRDTIPDPNEYYFNNRHAPGVKFKHLVQNTAQEGDGHANDEFCEQLVYLTVD